MQAPANVRHRAHSVNRQYGLSLVELMIALSIGLAVSMAAIAMLISGKAAYAAQEEATRLQETGRYAMSAIGRAVRQGAYVNWENGSAGMQTADLSPSILGLDAKSINKESAGLESPLSSSINGSDVLAIRFVGSGAGDADGSVLNCAGFGVAEPAELETDRGWSIFYLGAAASGEPELRCKYRGKNNWSADAIASGVESFQVLYGLDTDADGLANRFVNASEIRALDQADTASGAASGAVPADQSAMHRRSWWKKVVALRVAMLVRGVSKQPAEAGGAGGGFHLFGPEYSAAHGASDPGIYLAVDALPVAVRQRTRKIFISTIQLRNPDDGGS